MVNINTTHINESSLGASIIFKSKGALRPSELSLRNVAQTSGLSCLCSHWSSHLGHPSLPALWFQILTFQELAQNLPPGKLFLMLSYQTLFWVFTAPSDGTLCALLHSLMKQTSVLLWASPVLGTESRDVSDPFLSDGGDSKEGNEVIKSQRLQVLWRK